MVTPALMVLGTASSVGKSLVTVALARMASDRGLRVAPFKAQNMSLEAAVTPDGKEIGRAQFVQAIAARSVPCAEMNPILLKPTGDMRSQVVVLGERWGDADAWEYHARRTAELFPLVVAAYRRLAADNDIIVLEGAGSPVEMNLRAGDIVNMRMADAADARCLLVVDIDRGGAFASLIGTLGLLTLAERARIAGFVINKFRGDARLFGSVLDDVARSLEIENFGIVPWFDDLDIDDEDRYAAAPFVLSHISPDALRIAVIAYPYAANLSDCDPLVREPSICLRFVTNVEKARGADVIILPGSKATAASLQWLRANGWEALLAQHHAAGGIIVGICGGMQLLGRTIADPHAVEGGGTAMGLGLLRLETTLARRKTTRSVQAVLDGHAFDAYEIHVGESTIDEAPLCSVVFADGTQRDEGARTPDGLIVATYLHDLFGNDAVRSRLIGEWRALRNLGAVSLQSRPSLDVRIDAWTNHVRAHTTLETLVG